MSGGREYELLVGLGNLRVQFWACPDGHSDPVYDSNGRRVLRQTVEWRGGVAYCLTPGCGRSSAKAD